MTQKNNKFKIIIPALLMVLYFLIAAILDLFLIGGSHYTLFRLPKDGEENVKFVVDDESIVRITDIQYPYSSKSAFVFIEALKKETTNLRAMWFDKKQKAATGKELTYIVSGGQGRDEVISEAESMKTYLVECGIPGERIIMEDQSTSTYENMRNSYQIIRELNPDAKIAFSTTEYHVFRSGYLAEKIGMKAIGMGSRTKLYFYVNAWIREFVANMKNQRGNHIRNIAVVIFALLILTIISYIFQLM